MRVFKQIKDMKATVAATPQLMAEAHQLSANAHAMAAAQQAAATIGVPTSAPASAADFGLVAGVSLALYAEIARSLATVNYDQAKAPELAAAKGVATADWLAAVEGWNGRMQAEPAVARQFNALYMGH